ncbi:MAG: hypothetical protein GX087_06030 [Desulfobulbaceae bacterium]|nr:hypothetical protein [Desulfobulbaceae bacterium]
MLRQLVENAYVAAQDTAEKVLVRARKEHEGQKTGLRLKYTARDLAIARLRA